METIQIQKVISIEPNKLDHNVLEHIEQTLKKSYINYCSKKTGYIVGINKILNIQNNIISNTSANPKFTVIMEASVLKPKIGSVIECEVNMIFIHGIFAEKNNLRVLIPSTSLKKYEFNNQNNQFVSEKVTITNGSRIRVEIMEIKYEKKNYSCIGKLKSVLKRKNS